MSNTDLLSGSVEAAQSQPASSGSDNVAVETAQDNNGSTGTPKRRTGGLSGMVIAELRELAVELGITDTKGMRKGDLIAAIRERQGKPKRRPGDRDDSNALPLDGMTGAGQDESKQATASGGAATQAEPTEPAAEAPSKADAGAGQQDSGSQDSGSQDEAPKREGSSRRRRGASRGGAGNGGNHAQRGEQESRSGGRSGQQGQHTQDEGDQSQREAGEQRKSQGGQGNQGGSQGSNGRSGSDDDERGGGRRSRRSRDRRRRGSRGDSGGNDPDVREDDVLLPIAGILDVLDNYAFVRTSGYLPGQHDVYVSLSLVRKYGLRKGDAITGVVRQPREGEQQRQKFNPLVRVDTINGLEPDNLKRPEFTKLTPLYPNERLRLETEPTKLTTRVIDLVMPVGKGQRALIVSPPKAGKTTILQDIANAITTNNPECWLMVVLVDERPEEVTDMQRSVKGEVIASTFDRPPSDHTTAAELSIERAKRLVEMGHDVVVLLDSITRLGRAYNLAAPASGRILSGGVDSTALYPPKRFLGAARNIEEGGSLTIFATAMVETGSTMDTVIFEEFKGTGNAELKLDRKIAERRVFPAVDVNPSGTRKEELLLSPDELAVTHKLHRVLHALDSQQSIDLLLDRLKKSKTNIEFLMQVSKTAPGQDDDQAAQQV
ncbi:transcription termination factor Rho [Haloechinothrix sp. LS1_15]|uniref:transcription termination factor Rho n=1 Tax=Haloechinothrix sp. LS1_15 TaxID=2652248 RepID=UPI002947CF04|nr:transcription termination factor Rho [Haloechinothrix sp. LS1_15]MDV6011775.1 transcription termination factor Rho [Haloechinothrix sp. LS1_15]